MSKSVQGNDPAQQTEAAQAGASGAGVEEPGGSSVQDIASEKPQGLAGESASTPVQTKPGNADDLTPVSADSNAQTDAPVQTTPAPADTPAPPAEGAAAPALAAVDDEIPYEESHADMYRLYNPNSGEHFYTADLVEARSVAEAGWRWEGIGWVAPTANDRPVFRLYNPNAGDHHYTLNPEERSWLIGLGWNDEGIGWYSDADDQTAVYRQYNPNAVAGAHNFTTDAAEDSYLGAVGWNREGTAWYATSGPEIPIVGFWLVTAAWGSLERYWVGSDAQVAKNRLIDPAEGSGWWSYATGSGAVVRGKHDRGDGYVYVADNDGRLASTADGVDGWLVTDAYDGGMQRYYYIASERAMRSGFFEVDGIQYFGLGGEGYVLRGRANWGDHVLLANDDGVMAGGPGWLVADAYEGVARRYYLERVFDSFCGAKTGFFDVDGTKFYGVAGFGHVAQNEYARDGSIWYWADNDGALSETVPPAWLVMTDRAQGFSSPTEWLVLVDTDECNVGIFRGEEGNWTLDDFFPCVCGAPGSSTITGTYSAGYRLDALPAYPNARYATNIIGGYFFHTILNSESELGQHLSHGCVRLAYPKAIWIHDNLPSGSTINLY